MFTLMFVLLPMQIVLAPLRVAAVDPVTPVPVANKFTFVAPVLLWSKLPAMVPVPPGEKRT